MSPLVSRILVAAVLLPLVIGLVYLGDWWLFGLALIGGLLALHELYAMARELRPLVLGGYLGFVATLLGLILPVAAVVVYLVISLLVLIDPIWRAGHARRAARRAA